MDSSTKRELALDLLAAPHAPPTPFTFAASDDRDTAGDTIVRGPWPQPSPWSPDAMLPAVLHVPEEERADWRRHVLARYRRQLVTEPLAALAWAIRNPGLAEVSDARFVELLCDGPMSRFLTPDLEDDDERLFGAILDRPTDEHTWVKADFRIMGLVSSSAASLAASTVVLFGRAPSGSHRLVAVSVDGDVFSRDDGDAFELAKYVALQSAGTCVTLHMHPRLHFPFDAVNAVARTRLPDGHVLKELLRPHLRLELAVSDAVLHGPRSVLRPGHIYSPYAATHREALALVGSVWTGHPHASGTPSRAYPPFRFPVRPPRVHSRYGDFLDRYLGVVRAFVTDVLATLAPTDSHATDFARHVAHFLPGFPLRETPSERLDFVSAIATTIFSLSIAHTTDHHLFGIVDPREVPFRLRTTRPRRGERIALDRSSLVTTRDLVAQRLCSRMYFEPYPLERLVDVRYAFAERSLAGAGSRFVAGLRAAERALSSEGVPIYLALEAMAPSVQF